jgi:hypothetical protein
MESAKSYNSAPPCIARFTTAQRMTTAQCLTKHHYQHVCAIHWPHHTLAHEQRMCENRNTPAVSLSQTRDVPNCEHGM